MILDEYWFYHIGIENVIKRKNLNQEEKDIVDQERNRFDEDNKYHFWIGYNTELGGWKFLRNGLPVLYVNDERPNIARKKLEDEIDKLFDLLNR